MHSSSYIVWNELEEAKKVNGILLCWNFSGVIVNVQAIVCTFFGIFFTSSLALALPLSVDSFFFLIDSLGKPSLCVEGSQPVSDMVKWCTCSHQPMVRQIFSSSHCS